MSQPKLIPPEKNEICWTIWHKLGDPTKAKQCTCGLDAFLKEQS